MGIQVAKIGEFKGHQQSIYSLAVMDESHFLSVGGEGMLVKWELNSPDGTLISKIPEQLFCLAFNPKNKNCAVGTRSGSIYEFNIENMALQRQWIAHAGSVFDLLYQGDDLLSCGGDGSLKSWKANETRPDRTLKLSEKSLRCLFMDEETLWAGGSEGKVWQLSLDTFTLLSSFQAGQNSVFALSSTDSTLFTAGRDAHLHAWKEGTEQNDIAAHWYTIHALSQSPDGQYLATGSMDKTIKLWNAHTLELLKVIDHDRYAAHRSSVNKIIWLDTTHFISCGDDRMIMCFEISLT
ncbi:MAG: WD40 repeat domain-containing protein [Bacteroidia bacterium]